MTYSGSSDISNLPGNFDAALVKEAAVGFIVSASGWRKVFGQSDESTNPDIAISDVYLTALAADAFADFLKERNSGKLTVCLGTDTRPTGPALSDIFIRVFSAHGIRIYYTGQCSAPELMCYTNNSKKINAFAYVSASHNPVGHNGFKFGLDDGAVIGGDLSAKLISIFWDKISRLSSLKHLYDRLIAVRNISGIYKKAFVNKNRSARVYTNFILDTAAFPLFKTARKFKNAASASARNISVIADLNGSARSTGPDAEILRLCGYNPKIFNNTPGLIVHRIVPEGSSLDLCCEILDREHTNDNSCILGYVPDNDGDRGNLVYYSEKLGKSCPIPAQQVFALAVLSELIFLRSITSAKTALVVNGPTSNRINRISEILSCEVFRVEVGEANVVMKAKQLQNQGYIVRIIGEGSNGGNITLPSTVRDPINTVLSVLKLLSLSCREPSFRDYFEKWCVLSGQSEKYHTDFTLDDILASIPEYTTTDAFEDTARAAVNLDHKQLKKNYESVFLSEWEKNKEALEKKYNIACYKIINYEGVNEIPGPGARSGEEKGGFKVEFFTAGGNSCAYIWMRGSGTEPVFRVLADVRGDDPEFESYMLNWHKNMIKTANGG